MVFKISETNKKCAWCVKAGDVIHSKAIYFV